MLHKNYCGYVAMACHCQVRTCLPVADRLYPRHHRYSSTDFFYYRATGILFAPRLRLRLFRDTHAPINLAAHLLWLSQSHECTAHASARGTGERSALLSSSGQPSHAGRGPWARANRQTPSLPFNHHRDEIARPRISWTSSLPMVACTSYHDAFIVQKSSAS
ncbi:hypothetical protein FA95DRAFT_313887 [Auriscalpium vulgare]|uniref:Uncharacterized protein n=1 Tax=Auriscalpium vulgare TaxID=40419 RepID=A0ACB8S5C9_9AGAM|nr:hypothetical protein FA95DRAFT_313887 [Auriscalpium vulgare]